MTMLGVIAAMNATALPAQPVVVEIRHFRFDPAEVTVRAGETVRWENRDFIEHTATSQTGPGTLVPSGLFDSGPLSFGDLFEFTPAQDGVVEYFCVPHGSSMQGRIVVTPRCPADFNGDGGIDGADVEAFFAAWEAGDPGSDINRDGGQDGADVGAFFEAWGAGGCA